MCVSPCTFILCCTPLPENVTAHESNNHVNEKAFLIYYFTKKILQHVTNSVISYSCLDESHC